MDQLSLSLRSVHKNGNGNGNGHGPRRPGHKQFSRDIRRLIDDLRAADELRAEELKRVAQLRRGVYRAGIAAGVSPMLLRVLMDLNTRRAP